MRRRFRRLLFFVRSGIAAASNSDYPAASLVQSLAMAFVYCPNKHRNPTHVFFSFPISLQSFQRYGLRPLILVAFCGFAGCRYTAIGNNIDGKRLYEQGQFTAALQSFQKATARDPNNADAFYNMAATYHKMGTVSSEKQYLTQAEDLYRQCLALSPDHVDCHRGLAVLLAETDRPDQAFTLLKDWAKYRPGNADAFVELARLHHEFGKQDVATQHLEHALSLDYNNWRALRALAMVRENTGDVDQALANYQRSYQLNGFQHDVASRIARLQQTRNGQLSTGTNNTRWVSPAIPRPRF